MTMKKPTARRIVRPAGIEPGDELLSPLPATVMVGDDGSPSARLRPQIGQLLGDTFEIAQKELSRMKAQIGDGENISVKDLESVSKMVFTLLREMREEEKRHSPENVPDEVLLREILKDPLLREAALQILSEYVDAS